jgi:uncharacterized protein
MTAHDDHVSILREAYAQWVHTKGSDCECWMNIIADDVSLGSLADGSPEVPFTARRSSKSGVRAYLEDLMHDWEMVSHTMSEFIAQDDRVAVVGWAVWRHKGTGKVQIPERSISGASGTARRSISTSITTPPGSSLPQRRKRRQRDPAAPVASSSYAQAPWAGGRRRARSASPSRRYCPGSRSSGSARAPIRSR